MLLALLPAALAEVAVQVDVEVGAALPVHVLASLGRADATDVSTATTFYADGDRCELLVNGEANATHTFVALNLRCRDPRGRETVHTEPNVLFKYGQVATVRIGDGGGVRFQVATVAGDLAPPLALRRDFFIRPGSASYGFFTVGVPWTSLACEGEIPVELRDGAVTSRFDGRFQPGDVIESTCLADGVEVPVVVSFF